MSGLRSFLPGFVRDTWSASDLAFLTVATSVVLVSDGAPWRGEWARTVDAVAGTTILTGPVLAGLVALRAGPWISTWSFFPHVRHTRSWALLGAPVVGPLASGLGVYLVATLVAAIVTVAYRPSDALDPTVWLMGLLLAPGYALLGALFAQFLPRSVAAVGSIAGSYVVAVVSSRTAFHFLDAGGATGSSAGYSVNHASAVAWVVTLAGICFALFGFNVLRLRASRFPGFIACGILLCGAGSALSVTAGPLVGPSRSPKWVCEKGAPAVCMLAGNSGRIEAWTTALAGGATRLRSLGIDPPETFVQPAPGDGRDHLGQGRIVVNVDSPNLSAPDDLSVVYSLVSPSSCSAFAAEEPPIEALRAQNWLAAFVAGELQLRAPIGESEDSASWRKRTDRQLQVDWARETYAALAACDIQRLKPPV